MTGVSGTHAHAPSPVTVEMKTVEFLSLAVRGCGGKGSAQTRGSIRVFFWGQGRGMSGT